MKSRIFGTLGTDETIFEYTLENERLTLSVISFGAILTRFTADGRDIVGGFDKLSDYLRDDSHQGGIIGRVANRIADAEFVMDGVTYHLPKNDGKNCLHGGIGFDRRLWEVAEFSKRHIVLSYNSKDKEEGFPASLSVQVTYTLLDTGFSIEYTATPDGKTPISLTNHAYFNLEGFGGTVDAHRVKIHADTYTEVDGELIPTGRRPSVLGTVFDLRDFVMLGDCFSQGLSGFDHNFNLSPVEYTELFGKRCSLAAEVTGGGYKMSVYTDRPAIQLYTGNFLGNGPCFRGGVKQIPRGALCLETQTEPNSVNRGCDFYGKGEAYRHFTAYLLEKTAN